MKIAFALCAVSLAAAPAWGQAGNEGPQTLALEDYLDWEEAGSPQISPDGERIVYTRRRVDAMADRWASELWIMDADGGRHRFLTEGSAVRWSPEGDRIAFLRPVDERPQLFTRWMDASGAESQITHTDVKIRSFDWAPDGRRIAFLGEVPFEPPLTISLPSRPEGADWTPDPFVTDRLNYRVDRQGARTGHDHLFVTPADGGTPRQLTEGEWDATLRFSGVGSGGFDWTPDGRYIVFDGNREPDPTGDDRVSAIHRVSVETGEITTLVDDGGFWGNPAVSPDGRHIAYVGHEPEAVNYPANSLNIVSADGSDIRILRDDLPDTPGTLIWAGNSRGLYYSMNYRGSTQLAYTGLNGDTRTLTEGGHRFYLASMSDGGEAAGTLSSPVNTGNVALVGRRGRLSTLTDLNGDILDGVTLGRVEEINYTSPDGTPVQGWVVYPPDFDPGESYPLMLHIHGGPHAMYGVNFNFRFQEWASQGYVVVFTNPRGSTGYTPEFANAIDNAYPGRADLEDLLAGVDTVVARGFIDEARMYVTGCSGGGVLTAWVVAHTDRFAAAASLCPVINWISFAGQADISAWSFNRFRPNYWEDPTNWLEHSPIMHAHNITTPTLLMTGAEDLRTPLAQAEELYANLVRRGVPSVLISMNREYHGTWSVPSNMLRTQLYLREWFERYPGKEDEDSGGSEGASDG
jgi:dipeptidyl aminopeptidase/acylaminoacyl peptidase